MGRKDSIHAVLSRTEADLLKAMAAAAQDGDLELLDKARWVIGQVQQITNGLARNGSTQAMSSTRRRTPSAVGPKSIKENNKSYPAFRAKNGTLYRAAWSRKKNSEYEHKVPKSIVDQIVQAMAAVATADGRPVTVDAILATANSASVLQIPQYQAYLVVSWLRRANCVDQVGRDGYQVPPDISSSAEREWQRLLSKV